MSILQNSQEITNTINNQPLIDSYEESNEIINTRITKNDEFIILYNNKKFIYILIMLVLLALGFTLIFFVLLGIIFGFTIFLTLSFIIVFLGLAKLRKSIKLIKNINENKLKVTITNYLGCALTVLNLCLENTNFIIEDLERYEPHSDQDRVKIDYTRICIVHTFENFDEIDIDKSNIVNTPIFVFYYFQRINTELYGGPKKLENKLNSFMNSPVNSQNINKIIDPNIKYKILSDHFYSYIVQNPDFESFKLGFIICFIILTELYGLVIYCSARQSQLDIYYWIVIIIGYLFLVLFFILIFIYDRNKIARIDFIFSKNFDKIFIGTVRRNGKSYRNKFIFKMNKIKSFILDKKRNKSCILKVIVLNDYIDICQINNSNFKDEEKLISLLNEKFKKNDIKKDEHPLLIP